MKKVTANTIEVRICIAGDYGDAVRACRSFCMRGLCVTVQRADYVYTGGLESGVVVGLINYPRFPSTEAELMAAAERLGMSLMNNLHQHSFSIVGPSETTWYSRREG